MANVIAGIELPASRDGRHLQESTGEPASRHRTDQHTDQPSVIRDSA
jgi:hypothetical protein